MNKVFKLIIGVVCLAVVAVSAYVIVNKITGNKKEKDTNVVANKEISSIKDAFEDKEWIKKNIISVMFWETSDEFKEELYNMHKFKFEKIGKGEEQTYIVQAESEYRILVLVSFKDGKIKVSKDSVEVACFEDLTKGVVDIENGIVRGLPDTYDSQSTIYEIKDGEFVPVFEWKFGEIVNGMETRVYSYKGEKITSEEYSKKLKEYEEQYTFETINKDLTNENIDNYVK